MGWIRPQRREFGETGRRHIGRKIEAQGIEVPSMDEVTPEPEPDKPTRSQALDELTGNVNPSTTKYKTTGSTIVTRILKATGMDANELTIMLDGMVKREELPAEMTLVEADEVAKRINA